MLNSPSLRYIEFTHFCPRFGLPSHGGQDKPTLGTDFSHLLERSHSWSSAPAWKAGRLERASRVQIPLSPPPKSALLLTKGFFVKLSRLFSACARFWVPAPKRPRKALHSHTREDLSRLTFWGPPLLRRRSGEILDFTKRNR